MENPEKYQEKKNISMDMPEKSATVRQRVEEIQNGREQKEKEKKEEKFRFVLQALAEEDEEIDIMNPVPQEFNIIEKSNHEQKQKELEAQKQRELEAQKQRELKAQKQRELEAQKQRELEAQKQKELEEQKQKELEAQKKKEPEAQKEVKMSPSLQKLYEENEEDEEIDIMNPVPQEFNITEKSIREQKKVEEQKESEAQEQKELEEAVEREKKYNDMPEKSATVQQRIDEIQRGRDLEEQKIAQEEQEEIQRKVDLLVKGREQIETEEAVEREKKYNDMPKEKSATVQQRVEEIERGREQEIIKMEAIKQDMPLTVNEKKIENLKQNDNGQQEVKKEGDIRRLKPGEALTRYIKETRSKQAFEKDKKRIPMLEEALQKAEGCCEQIMEESWDLDKLKDNIKSLDAAIIKVDGYIKKSKRFGHKDVTPPANAEERSLREAAKMLRIQLFLEKMVLYERIDKVETILKEDIDEKELYRIQLDADARMKLYGEYMDKNKAEKEEADKKKSITQDMLDRKNKQLIAENSRQMELYSGKISESEKQAKLLQEKIVIKGYSVRHKQFNRNEVYKQQVEIKIDELRPVIVKEWLDDNFQQIKDNAGKLIKEIEKDAKDANKIKGIKELEGLDKLLQTDLKDDENLAAVAMQYQKFFNNMAQMKDGTISLIPREIRDFMAAQIVLFEKRNLLKKDYNDALAKKDEAEKQQVVQKDKEKEKQQVVHKKDEKEKVEERIEEHEKKEGLKGKPEEVQGGSKEDLSQALVPYQKAAQQLEKNNDNSTEFAQMYQSLQSCISMMQNGELKQDVMKQLQEHVYTYMMNLMLKSPQFAFKGKKNGNVPRYGIKNPVLDLRKQMNALAKMNREQKDAVRNLMLLLPVDEKIQELPKVQQESQAIVKHNAIYDYMKLQKNRIEKIAPDTYENIMKLYAEFIWKEQKGSVDDELVQKLQDSLNQLVTKIANAKSPMLKKDSYARTYIKMLPSGQENNHKYDSLIEKRNTIKTFKTAQILLTEPEEVDVRDLGYEPATVREITKEEYEARMKQQNQSENPALAQEEVEKQDESQALVKYSTIYDHMEKQKEIVGKQAPELYSTIMTQLHEETEKKDTKKVQGVEQAETKKSVHDIFAESIKEFNKEQQSRQRAKTDEALDTKEAKKKLMERIEEKLRKERLARERQNQSDITEKEKEAVAQKKKKEDLEFQRNNNEYGLQGMASEEKEKKEKIEKLREQEAERKKKERMIAKQAKKLYMGNKLVTVYSSDIVNEPEDEDYDFSKMGKNVSVEQMQHELNAENAAKLKKEEERAERVRKELTKENVKQEVNVAQEVKTEITKEENKQVEKTHKEPRLSDEQMNLNLDKWAQGKYQGMASKLNQNNLSEMMKKLAERRKKELESESDVLRVEVENFCKEVSGNVPQASDKIDEIRMRFLDKYYNMIEKNKTANNKEFISNYNELKDEYEIALNGLLAINPEVEAEREKEAQLEEIRKQEEQEQLRKAQKERNEKARVEELERIHKDFDKTHERIDELTKQIEELRDTRYLGYYSAQGNAVGDAMVAMDKAQLEYMEAERKMLIEHMEAQLRILEKIGEVEEYDMDQYNYQEEYHKEFEYAEGMQHELDAKKEEFMKQSEAYEKASAEYKTWFKESLTQVQNLKANAQGMGSMINALEEGMEQMKIEEILYELAKDEENSEETLEMQDIADAVELIKGIEQTEDENLYNEELLGEYMEKSGKIAKISHMIQEAYGNWMVNKRDDMSQDE